MVEKQAYRKSHLSYGTDGKRCFVFGKGKKQKEAIDRVDEWYKYQLPIEKEHGRNINKFNEMYKRCKDTRKREIIKLFTNSRIEPVYMYNVPTDTANEFNIGD